MYHKMKERITITIDKELLKFLDLKVHSKLFATRSYGFEHLIVKKIIKEKGYKNEGTNNDNAGQRTP